MNISIHNHILNYIGSSHEHNKLPIYLTHIEDALYDKDTEFDHKEDTEVEY